MDLPVVLRLAGNALGVIGAVLVFFEFFRQPSYISYNSGIDTYDIDLSPQEIVEHGWAGRVGALLVAVAFALNFFAVFLG